MQICIIDYGVGNLFNLQNAFSYLGFETIISGKAEDVDRADKLVLPGVGAFCDAAEKLRATGLDEVVTRRAAQGTPLLGICLGMQLLFDESLEYGSHRGLGLIPGRVVPLAERVADKSLKIPHMGWNALDICRDDPIFTHVKSGEHVYFVHSYCAVDCQDHTLAVSGYGCDVTAAVRRGNVWGMQFHPEKSGETGLNLLRGFGAL